jgi:hypothetical protein
MGMARAKVSAALGGIELWGPPQFKKGPDDGVAIIWANEPFAIKQLRDPANARGDTGQPTRHRLDDDSWHTFGAAWMHHHVSAIQESAERGDARNMAMKVDIAENS